MLPPEKIEAYISTICSQIRWRRVHPQITKEMRDHINDQRDAYLEDGLAEEEATDRSLHETGDAMMLGTELDRTHRPKPQWAMLLGVCGMLIVGILLQFALDNAGRTPYTQTDPLTYVASVCIGIAFMFICYFADFTLLGKHPHLTQLVVFMVFALSFFTSPVYFGMRYYAVSCTLLMPLAFACFVFSKRGKGLIGFVQCLGVIAVWLFLTLLIPSNSGMMLIFLTGAVLLCIAVHRNWFGYREHLIIKLHIGLLIACFVCALLFLVLVLYTHPNVKNTLYYALFPEQDPTGVGFQGTMVRDMLRNARLWGTGDVTTLMYHDILLPDLNSSYILTSLIWYFGWIPFSIVMGAFAVFFVSSFVHCTRHRSMLGTLVSVAVLLTLAFQVIFYVLNNLGVNLFSSTSMPLLSYGVRGMIANLVLIGFLLSVFRSGHIVQDNSLQIHQQS